MASLPIQRYTPELYLEIDRKAESRSEYVAGEILAMAGASRQHNRITLNIGASLTEQLRGKPCEPFTSERWSAVRHWNSKTAHWIFCSTP